MNPPKADPAAYARPLTLLVTGAKGMLAHALRAEATVRGHHVVALSREELDVTDRAAVHRALVAARPHAVLQCAAFSAVDDAEKEPDSARAINADGAANVADLCVGIGARFVYPSTDYVFSGDATRPYRPDDAVAPLGAYARSKLAGEKAALRTGSALVVRTSWLFGVGRRNYLSAFLERARAGEALHVSNDQRASPTWTADLASVILSLLERGAAPGVYHAVNSGDATRYDIACAAVSFAGLSTPVMAVPTGAVAWQARRPRYSVLDCSATEAIVGPIPHWRDALQKAIQTGL